MNRLIVTSIFQHPIKGCRSIRRETLAVDAFGPEFDHRWLVINGDRVFTTQRGDPTTGATGVKSMCLIQTHIMPDLLIVKAPGMQDLYLPLCGFPGTELDVRVWNSVSKGIDQGNDSARWFTEYLSREVPGNYRLVRMPDDGNRLTEIGNVPVRYSDAYPFLLASEASLATVNSFADVPIPMTNFRPNIVVGGCKPFFEDELLGRTFMIGDVTFTGVKPCERCAVPGINQETAEQGKFPANVLAKHHKEFHSYLVEKMGEAFPRKNIFGMNLNHHGTGTIKVGDEVIFLN